MSEAPGAGGLPLWREIALGVGGAFRLAHFDLAGLSLMNLSRVGAARSFWAAMIVLPAYAALTLLRSPALGADELLLFRLAIEGLSYAVGWMAFPVILSYLLRGPEGEVRFIIFLCAYNWSAVVQMGAYLPATIIAELGVLPGDLGDGLVLGVVMAMLFYQWFIARVTLGLSPLLAMAVVAGDLITALLVENITAALIG